MFDDASIQRRLFTILVAYEAVVIGVCLFAGANMALAHGGSIAMALPLVLISVAEALRIPLAGWATRLRLLPRLMAGVVLLAIAVGSAEGLALAFEQMVNNRVLTVMDLQRELREASARLEAVAMAQKTARDDVSRIDAAIAAAVAETPKQPSLSGRTCAGKNGRPQTCAADIVAQKNYSDSAKLHAATLAGLRHERTVAQEKASASAPSSELTETVASVRDRLSFELAQSPMHRLAAMAFGVPVEKLTLAQFETVKKWAVGLLAVAFATMSMFVSIVAHAKPDDGRPGRVERAIRSYIARKRRGVAHVRTVERVIAVPGPETVRVKFIPYDMKQGRRVYLPEQEIGSSDPVPALRSLAGGKHS
jgi:hypothetical protein